MSSAKIKRHLKLLLKHPLQLSFIPILISVITSSYITALGVFYVGYKGGVYYQSMYSVTKIPVPVNQRFVPSNNSAPVYTTEPNINDDELLTPDESDEQFEKDMNDLLMDFDKDVYAYEKTSTVVLGTNDNYRAAGVPVERRMYNDNYKNEMQPDVNVITPNDSMGLFSFKNIVVPVLALGFAVLGINYLEHKHILRKKLATHHRKRSK